MYVVSIENSKKREKVRVAFTFPHDRFLLITTLDIIEDRYRRSTDGRPVVMVDKKVVLPGNLLQEIKEKISYGDTKWKPVNILLDLKDESHKQILTLIEAEEAFRRLRKKLLSS